MVVHVYSPRPSWRELDPAPLVAKLSQKFPHIRFIWGETTHDSIAPAESYDVIIVPVLGYDDARYRLGLGKGWYDRFLVAQPRAYKLGLAYNWAKVTELPHEPHDIPLDIIITD